MKNTVKTDAIRLSAASAAVNILLALAKLAAGIFGHSRALVADAVHSASDVISTLVVIASLIISGKRPDADHEYGHQKFESLASLLLGLLLAQVGISIGMDGVESILSGSYLQQTAPSAIAAAAAALSILVKEIMYRVTIRAAEKEKSSALRADAWHHRSDALSSIGSLAGVAFSMAGFPVMDAAAGVIISVFILKAAFEIGWDAVMVLTDRSCSADTEKAIRTEIGNVPGVCGVDLVKTRRFGSGFYTDVEISVDGSLSLQQAHAVAQTVHDRVEGSFDDVLHCMVHVNPAA